MRGPSGERGLQVGDEWQWLVLDSINRSASSAMKSPL
jgi:hypothetical protein